MPILGLFAFAVSCNTIPEDISYDIMKNRGFRDTLIAEVTVSTIFSVSFIDTVMTNSSTRDIDVECPMIFIPTRYKEEIILSPANVLRMDTYYISPKKQTQ